MPKTERAEYGANAPKSGLSWGAEQTREVRTEVKVKEAEIRLDETEVKELVREYVLSTYEVPHNCEVKVCLLDTERGDDAALVTITARLA